MIKLLILTAILGIFSGIFAFYRARFIETNEPQDKPLVSIIIPAKNEEDNLKKLLKSLTKCTYPNLEIIVVDDNSTDRTFDVAKSYGAKVIHIDEHEEGFLGKLYACLQGFNHSSGEILIFVDADVELEKDAVNSIVYEVINSNGVVSICRDTS